MFYFPKTSLVCENISLFRERYIIAIFSRNNVMFPWSNEIFFAKKDTSRIPTHFIEITRFNANFHEITIIFFSMIICCHSYRSIKASQEKKLHENLHYISLLRENIVISPKYLVISRKILFSRIKYCFSKISRYLGRYFVILWKMNLFPSENHIRVLVIGLRYIVDLKKEKAKYIFVWCVCDKEALSIHKFSTIWNIVFQTPLT